MTEQLRELEGQTPLTDAVLAQIPSTMDTQLDADFMNIMVRHARDLERALTAAKAELAEKAVDAARYRWLRHGLQVRREQTMRPNVFRGFIVVRPGRCLLPEGVAVGSDETLDAAIDAAIDAARGKP